MKLCEAAVLCEGNNRAFTEVYKIYNYKDDDMLRAYTDFVIHEPVEWMRGFPAAWKSSTMFSKPRAAFHRLLRTPAVVSELGEAYCTQVHDIIWNAFKNNMNSILEKRGASNDNLSVSKKSSTTHLTAESVSGQSDDEALPPCPHVPVPISHNNIVPKNSVVYAEKKQGLDFKHKFQVVNSILQTLLTPSQTADENVRLRAALSSLLEEYERA
jgi:hypothetical protein